MDGTSSSVNVCPNISFEIYMNACLASEIVRHDRLLKRQILVLMSFLKKKKY